MTTFKGTYFNKDFALEDVLKKSDVGSQQGFYDYSNDVFQFEPSNSSDYSFKEFKVGKITIETLGKDEYGRLILYKYVEGSVKEQSKITLSDVSIKFTVDGTDYTSTDNIIVSVKSDQFSYGVVSDYTTIGGRQFLTTDILKPSNSTSIYNDISIPYGSSGNSITLSISYQLSLSIKPEVKITDGDKPIIEFVGTFGSEIGVQDNKYATIELNSVGFNDSIDSLHDFAPIVSFKFSTVNPVDNNYARVTSASVGSYTLKLTTDAENPVSEGTDGKLNLVNASLVFSDVKGKRNNGSDQEVSSASVSFSASDIKCDAKYINPDELYIKFASDTTLTNQTGTDYFGTSTNPKNYLELTLNSKWIRVKKTETTDVYELVSSHIAPIVFHRNISDYIHVLASTEFNQQFVFKDSTGADIANFHVAASNVPYSTNASDIIIDFTTDAGFNLPAIIDGQLTTKYVKISDLLAEIRKAKLRQSDDIPDDLTLRLHALEVGLEHVCSSTLKDASSGTVAKELFDIKEQYKEVYPQDN